MSTKIRVALMYSDNQFGSPINPEVVLGWSNHQDLIDEEATLAVEMLRDGRFTVFNFSWLDLGPDLTFLQLHNLDTGERLTNVRIDETVDAILVRGVGGSEQAHSQRLEICRRLRQLRHLRRTTLINPLETVLADLESKRYLAELWARGIPMPATFLAKSLAEVRQLGNQFPDYVVKPIQGFGGFGVERFPGGDEKEVERFLQMDGEVLVQEFIPAIEEGERSILMAFEDAAYAILKRPQTGNFRTNFSHGATIERSNPTDAEVDFCRCVLSVLGLPSILSRIDLVGPRNAPLLMEATMSCTGLFLRDINAEAEVAQLVMDIILRIQGNLKLSGQI